MRSTPIPHLTVTALMVGVFSLLLLGSASAQVSSPTTVEYCQRDQAGIKVSWSFTGSNPSYFVVDRWRLDQTSADAVTVATVSGARRNFTDVTAVEDAEYTYRVSEPSPSSAQVSGRVALPGECSTPSVQWGSTMQVRVNNTTAQAVPVAEQTPGAGGEVTCEDCGLSDDDSDHLAETHKSSVVGLSVLAFVAGLGVVQLLPRSV